MKHTRKMAPHHLLSILGIKIVIGLTFELLKLWYGHFYECQPLSTLELTSCSTVTWQTLCHSEACLGLLSTESHRRHTKITYFRSDTSVPNAAEKACKPFSSPTVLSLMLSCVPKESMIISLRSRLLYYKTIREHSSYYPFR